MIMTPMADAGLVVVGRGKLGRTLARALAAELVPGREAAERLPPVLARHAGALVFLAVPDGIVAPLAAELAALALPGGPSFAHLSGALGLEALAPLAAAGLAVGSLHPLQPFPSERPPSAFAGTWFAVDASDGALLARLVATVERLGGTARRVRDSERALYHAAAALAANCLVGLAAESSALLGELGWTEEDALRALLPLMRGALDGLAERGLPDALAGPIRRGDAETVRRHLDALGALADPLPDRVYRALSLAVLRLAVRLGLDGPTADAVAATLASPAGPSGSA
jgi:predicted short-subunit dehydrogenase-like oxidoreductase (DUF2520 family)